MATLLIRIRHLAMLWYILAVKLCKVNQISPPFLRMGIFDIVSNFECNKFNRFDAYFRYPLHSYFILISIYFHLLHVMIVYESNQVIIALDILLLNDHATFPQSISGIFTKTLPNYKQTLLLANQAFQTSLCRIETLIISVLFPAWYVFDVSNERSKQTNDVIYPFL